jgi:hypothetical protein
MMENITHKYYCTRCERFVFGATLHELVHGVNRHISACHPSDYAAWTVEGMPHSKNYTGSAPSPEYLVQATSTAIQKAPVLPALTASDREQLKVWGIRWD